jgi:hypothetical protein
MAVNISSSCTMARIARITYFRFPNYGRNGTHLSRAGRLQIWGRSLRLPREGRPVSPATLRPCSGRVSPKELVHYFRLLTAQ